MRKSEITPAIQEFRGFMIHIKNLNAASADIYLNTLHRAFVSAGTTLDEALTDPLLSVDTGQIATIKQGFTPTSLGTFNSAWVQYLDFLAYTNRPQPVFDVNPYTVLSSVTVDKTDMKAATIAFAGVWSYLGELLPDPHIVLLASTWPVLATPRGVLTDGTPFQDPLSVGALCNLRWTDFRRRGDDCLIIPSEILTAQDWAAASLNTTGVATGWYVGAKAVGDVRARTHGLISSLSLDKRFLLDKLNWHGIASSVYLLGRPSNMMCPLPEGAIDRLFNGQALEAALRVMAVNDMTYTEILQDYLKV